MITPQLTPIDTPKTFDLDAMLGTTEGLLDKGGNEGGFVAEAKKSEETIKQTTPQQKAVEPQVIPAFTIPIQSSAIL